MHRARCAVLGVGDCMTGYILAQETHLPKKNRSTCARVPWFKIDLYLLKLDITYK